MFAPEQPSENGRSHDRQSWKVLVVDDDINVLNVTKLVLQSKRVFSRDIDVCLCENVGAAKDYLAQNHDVAVAIIDIVMETERDGIDLVEFIRNDLHNTITRVVLRSGQPALFSETDIITELNIQDYREKTELTASKLWCVIVLAIRSYNELVQARGSRLT